MKYVIEIVKDRKVFCLLMILKKKNTIIIHRSINFSLPTSSCTEGWTRLLERLSAVMGQMLDLYYDDTELGDAICLYDY